MQSWGASSKFGRRTTEHEPTKSGVIGIVAAALGRRYEDNIDDLAGLDFGVRIDQPGRLMRDYHTVKTNDGRPLVNDFRYYLEDAVFLAGLSGDCILIDNIAGAMINPHFLLYLGRRSCPPAGPVCLGVRKGVGLADALESEPWQASKWYKECSEVNPVNLKIITDTDDISHTDLSVRDVPVSFNQTHRKYNYRARKQSFFLMPIKTPIETDHDFFQHLGDA